MTNGAVGQLPRPRPPPTNKGLRLVVSVSRGHGAARISPSRVMLPMAFAVVLGGTISLRRIGTAHLIGADVMDPEGCLALSAQTFPVGSHRLQQLKGAAHIALGCQGQGLPVWRGGFRRGLGCLGLMNLLRIWIPRCPGGAWGLTAKPCWKPGFSPFCRQCCWPDCSVFFL